MLFETEKYITFLELSPRATLFRFAAAGSSFPVFLFYSLKNGKVPNTTPYEHFRSKMLYIN